MTAKTIDERQPLLPDASEHQLPSTSDTVDTLVPRKDAASSRSPLPPPSRSVDDDVLPETSTLGRTLGRRSAYMLVMSRIIGSGIFATPGAVLAAVGSPGLALLLWLVGAALSAAGLAVALEYGCALPRSGGHKVYLEYTFRRPRFLASTLVAANAVLLGFTASNCVVFSEYVLYAAGRRGDGEGEEEVLRKGVAVGMLTVVTGIHLVTPRFGVRLQDGLGWVKMGIVVFMVLCGLYVVVARPEAAAGVPAGGGGGGSWDRLWRDSNWNWGILCTALFKVLYSYSGLDNVTNVLNEVKDPVRTLRFVARAALVTACVMYLLINVAYLVVVPVDEIKGSGELIAALFFQHIFGPRLGGQVLPLLVALSAFGNVLVMVFALSRVKHEIARQGFLPFSDFLSSTRPFNSPFGGLLVNYIPSVLVIILPPSGKIYSFILEVEGYGAQITGLGVAVGLLWLRRKQPDLRRPYKAPSIAVGARIVLSVALLLAPLVPPKDRYPGGLFYATYAIAGMSTFVISVVYWYVWTILIPKWRGYSLEEEEATLADGTTITKLVHKPVQ